MERGMIWIVCYDVVEDKRRNHVFKALQGFGQNVQYSVFECELTLEKLKRLKELLETLIDRRTDNVRLYPMDEAAQKKVIVLGQGIFERPKAYVYIAPPTRDDHPF